MGPTRRAALRAAAIVALTDVWALRRAWGSVGERLAIAAAVVAAIVGAALLLTPWLHALVAAPGQAARRGSRRLHAYGAAVLGGVLLGLPLAATPTAQRAAGALAPLLVIAAITFGLAAIARMPRLPAALIGLTNVACVLLLPRGLYAAVRVALLVCGWVALARAWRRDLEVPPARVATTTAGALALLAAAWALSGADANVRFVTRVQAPAAGLVLDAVAMVKPMSAAPAAEPQALAAAPSSAAIAAPRLQPGDSLADAHLVLVTVDALRADRARADRMPHLAALAAGGVQLDRAYAAAPSTAASITAMMTAHHPGELADRPPTLAERLRAAGWNTAAFYPAGLFFDGGGALLPYAAAHFGVDWADTRTQPADAVTDAVLERVRVAVARGEPRSFFWLHYFDPHEPYERHGLPASATAIERYDAEVRAVDDALGRLIDGLRAFARPTLLVVTGDHGEAFGEHGGAYHGSSLYDEQLRVPLIIAVLGRSIPPSRSAAPVSLVELLPTLTAWLGGPRFGARDAGLDGGRDVFAALQSRRMIVRGEWKLIRDTRRDVDELYDLAADPAEERNLADARADVVASLRPSLEQWLNQSSVAELVATLGSTSSAVPARAGAARQLGAREAYSARDALRAALADPDARVRAEAALALAELTDTRAAAPLRLLLEDERFADRAAVMLGRLRDRAAAPRLEALCARPLADGDSGDATLRREAAHYLGFVGDRDAVGALLAAAADPRVRGSAYVAIGRIAGRSHDPAAAAALRARFAVEERADARADLAFALGLAGDAAAVPLLAAAAATDPPLPNASEALVRLGALARRAIGGLDFTCRSRAGTPNDALDEWLAATTCTVTSARARYVLAAPPGSDRLLLRARSSGTTRLQLIVDGQRLAPVELGPRYQELVKPIQPMVKPIRVELEREGAPIELDHLLLLRSVTTRPL